MGSPKATTTPHRKCCALSSRDVQQHPLAFAPPIVTMLRLDREARTRPSRVGAEIAMKR